MTIFKGYNAILVSVGTCFVITVLTFAVIGGWNKKTISAALGTIGGVVLAGIIASIVSYLAKLSGGGKEEAIMLSVAATNVTFNFRHLLFAEIIVSALGACMDVGMSIASSLSELKMKKPDMTAKELFKSGMNIGGDMIGTMTNTLILSFIGSSLLLIYGIKPICHRSNKHRSNCNRNSLCYIRKYWNCIHGTDYSGNICYF